MGPLAALNLVSCGSTNVPEPASTRHSYDGGDVLSAADAGDEPSVAANSPPFCVRTADDAVHRAFCGATPAQVHSLADLVSLLNFSTVGEANIDLLAHSTALFGSLVSPINPRLILVRGDGSFLAFHRGAQSVELIMPPGNLYLMSFTQACNAAPLGCWAGDLYTPRIESNWTQVQIRDAEDLKDTAFDCRQCHQRALSAPIPLMRELDSPWTHFFVERSSDPFPTGDPEPTGGDLGADYTQAKGDEAYGGVDGATVLRTEPMFFQGNVPRSQPLVFDGAKIAGERWPVGPNGTYSSTPQRSPTWDAAYDAFKRGEQLALPYFAPRATDPTKQAALSDMYTRYRNGEIGAVQLTDLSDIYPDDPETRAEIGLQTEPGATPAQTLVQGCGPCHNDVLDQSISRAHFSIALSRMSRAELDVAIQRVSMQLGDKNVMPPITASRRIDPNGLQTLIAYLQHDQRSADDDALLDRAAQLGMAGGAASGP
jgi:hypothetical protein